MIDGQKFFLFLFALLVAGGVGLTCYWLMGFEVTVLLFLICLTSFSFYNWSRRK